MCGARNLRVSFHTLSHCLTFYFYIPVLLSLKYLLDNAEEYLRLCTSLWSTFISLLIQNKSHNLTDKAMCPILPHFLFLGPAPHSHTPIQSLRFLEHPGQNPASGTCTSYSLYAEHSSPGMYVRLTLSLLSMFDVTSSVSLAWPFQAGTTLPEHPLLLLCFLSIASVTFSHTTVFTYLFHHFGLSVCKLPKSSHGSPLFTDTSPAPGVLTCTW